MNNNNKTEIATVANGCFWCTEAIFERVKGYDQVCAGKTGHAESIQIEFDPKVTSFEKILDIFWLKDESLEDSDNLPSPEIIAGEIVENLESALEQFGEIQESLKAK